MKLKPFLLGATLLTAPALLPATAHAQAAPQTRPATAAPAESRETGVEARFNASLAGYGSQKAALSSVDSTGALTLRTRF